MRVHRASVGRQSPSIEHIDGAYASTAAEILSEAQRSRRISSDHGAERGTRTPTSRLSPADFKSAASASSAIPAREYSFYR